MKPELLLHFDTFEQRSHVSPQFLARFSLCGRKHRGGVRVADGGGVGVLLPALERPADAGVVLDVAGELGPGTNVSSSFQQTILET